MARLARPQFVFAYGSLCALAHADDEPAVLHGHRRVWGVAMDNSKTLPGYKHYVRPDGSRPPVHVAFVDAVAGDGAVVGICRLVSAAERDALDDRERNYERVDVTEQIDRPPGRVWAYLGSPDGRARLTAARRADSAVVSSEYWDRVGAGLARLGGTELERFRVQWDRADLPLWELLRRDAAQS